MQVILAESAGFCYGVKRAVELAQKTAEEPQGCWMLGDLIHNTHVVNDLAARGVRKTDRPEALGAGDTVVIRSHGELKSVLDGLAARGVRCVNATCPNVVHIQELVSQAEQEGRQVVIIGEPHHPEVMGLASWCVHPLVFQGPEAVAEWVKNGDFQPEMPVSIVAQTTCIRELFESSCKILKKECTNVKIFDTICYATRKRQNEAAEIAAQVDVMVVVGDRKSANTKHLAEICRQNCSHVLSIEGADELSAADFAGCRITGLTAGASTPAGIIKEVKTTMSEEIKSTETMEESFEELLNQSFKTLNTGEKVTGIVTAITPTADTGLCLRISIIHDFHISCRRIIDSSFQQPRNLRYSGRRKERSFHFIAPYCFIDIFRQVIGRQVLKITHILGRTEKFVSNHKSRAFVCIGIFGFQIGRKIILSGRFFRKIMVSTDFRQCLYIRLSFGVFGKCQLLVGAQFGDSTVIGCFQRHGDVLHIRDIGFDVELVIVMVVTSC